MLSVGIPREIKPRERRVGLTPSGVRFLKRAGIRVLVERGAGRGSGFSDLNYHEAGAEIVRRSRDLYREAHLIKKVKEPLPPEWEFLRPHLLLFCFLHLASPENLELLQTLLNRKVTAFGLETVEKGGRTILLEPMSEIAGALAAYFAGFFKETVRVERNQLVYPPHFLKKMEELAASFPEIPERLSPGKGVVFGGGVVGGKAVETLLKMGGEVDLIEKRAERRGFLQAQLKGFSSRFRAWGPEENFERRLREAEVWIGCVHLAGQRAPLVLSEEEVESFSRPQPKLILDIAADQGGNFPGTHSTDYEHPLYLDPFGNLRFGVTNIPSLCGRAASEAIEKVSLPYTIPLAQDWRKALQDFPELRTALHLFEGKLVHEAVARAHQLSWEPFLTDAL